MRGDHLLLAVQRAEEAERVATEADRPDQGNEREARDRDGQQARTAAHARGGEHQVGEHEASRGLDADSRDEGDGREVVVGRGGGRAVRGGALWGCGLQWPTGARGARGAYCAGGEGERESQQQHDERVVVRAADGQLQQDGVQPDECDREARVAAHALRRDAHERHRAEARQHGDGLERPQRARDAKGGGCVAAEREQRPVGRVLVGPAEEVEDRVGGRLRGEGGVGVQAVQRAQARVADIAEHVLGDQRRP